MKYLALIDGVRVSFRIGPCNRCHGFNSVIQSKRGRLCIDCINKTLDNRVSKKGNIVVNILQPYFRHKTSEEVVALLKAKKIELLNVRKRNRFKGKWTKVRAYKTLHNNQCVRISPVPSRNKHLVSSSHSDEQDSHQS